LSSSAHSVSGCSFRPETSIWAAIVAAHIEVSGVCRGLRKLLSDDPELLPREDESGFVLGGEINVVNGKFVVTVNFLGDASVVAEVNLFDQRPEPHRERAEHSAVSLKWNIRIPSNPPHPMSIMLDRLETKEGSLLHWLKIAR